jgi:CRP/FNR family transcriptional regulator
MLRLLAGHMRLLSAYFAGATFDEVSFRLAQRLVIVADTLGVDCEDGIALSARLSQSDLAALAGTARQTVNRVLQDFQQRGWVSTHGSALILTDLESLRAFAEKGSNLLQLNI